MRALLTSAILLHTASAGRKLECESLWSAAQPEAFRYPVLKRPVWRGFENMLAKGYYEKRWCARACVVAPMPDDEADWEGLPVCSPIAGARFPAQGKYVEFYPAATELDDPDQIIPLRFARLAGPPGRKDLKVRVSRASAVLPPARLGPKEYVPEPGAMEMERVAPLAETVHFRKSPETPDTAWADLVDWFSLELVGEGHAFGFGFDPVLQELRTSYRHDGKEQLKNENVNLVGPVTRKDPLERKSNYTVVRFEDVLVGIVGVDRARWEAAFNGAPETRFGRPYGSFIAEDKYHLVYRQELPPTPDELKESVRRGFAFGSLGVREVLSELRDDFHKILLQRGVLQETKEWALVGPVHRLDTQDQIEYQFTVVRYDDWEVGFQSVDAARRAAEEGAQGWFQPQLPPQIHGLPYGMFVLDNKFHLVYRKDPYNPYQQEEDPYAQQDMPAQQRSSLVENQAADAVEQRAGEEQTRAEALDGLQKLLDAVTAKREEAYHFEEPMDDLGAWLGDKVRDMFA